VTDSICILPNTTGLGGPPSFQAKLIQGLQARGIPAHHDPMDPTCRAVLVIAGTKRLDLLIRAKQRGLPIVQRLNGLNWMHKKRKTGWKHYLKSEWGNWLLSTIRRNLADRIIYQSQFARQWWHTVYGAVKTPNRIIYNGVDLSLYTPVGAERPPEDFYRVLLVEGHLKGGMEQGLETAVTLVNQLNLELAKPVELMVVSDVPPSIREKMDEHSASPIRWEGVVPRSQVPAMDRSAHILFSADLNASCPNAVIEALACGLPVAAYATGALPELVTGDSGRVVPYGSDYWNLQPPDVNVLVRGVNEILADLPRFQTAARQRAEEAFSLDGMVDAYLEVLLGAGPGV